LRCCRKICCQVLVWEVDCRRRALWDRWTPDSEREVERTQLVSVLATYRWPNCRKSEHPSEAKTLQKKRIESQVKTQKFSFPKQAEGVTRGEGKSGEKAKAHPGSCRWRWRRSKTWGSANSPAHDTALISMPPHCLRGKLSPAQPLC
jgi:hypothetical protein